MLRPATLSIGNLQPLVTQTLHPGTKEVYGQLPLLDLNQLEKQPFTAYGQSKIKFLIFSIPLVALAY